MQHEDQLKAIDQADQANAPVIANTTEQLSEDELSQISGGVHDNKNPRSPFVD